jgi:hypothetical protein
MQKSPVFWVVVGVAGVWAYHKWVKPLPGGKQMA